MKSSEKEKWVEEIISRVAPAYKPVPDFEKWQREYPRAVEVLKSQGEQSTLSQSKRVTTITIWRAVRTRRLVKVAACALLVAGLIWILPSGETDGVSRVVGGVVLIRSEGSSDWIERRGGWEVTEGDELSVKEGNAVVRLADGTLLTMNSGSRLLLRQRRDDSRYSAYLRSGVVTAKVAENENAFEIESSEGRVRTLGTEFTVRMANNVLIERRLKMKGVLPIVKRIMAVTVIAGAVQLQADGKAQVIEAGSSGILVRNEVPLTGPEGEAVVRRLMLSSEAAGPMKPLLETHDQYLQELFPALSANDGAKVASCANRLSELWQWVGRMTEVKLRPRFQAELYESIKMAREKGIRDERIFLENADELMSWVDKIEDVGWINEIAHVCKQVEEYAEEIRDGGRSSKLGFSYVEHCLPGFLTYCEWFKRLPWDNPAEKMTSDDLLLGIERDLEVARREILYPENRDAGRFIKRSVQQVQKNVLEVRKRVEEDQTANEARVKMCGRLNTMTRNLSDLVTYAALASWEMQQTDKIESYEAFRQLLKRDFAGRGALGDLLIKEIEESLDLCAKLLESVDPKRR
ncbi:MAG: FecR domain-containing protein [Planctomycetota bacterium]|jgi:hypothetical protein